MGEVLVVVVVVGRRVGRVRGVRMVERSTLCPVSCV